MLAYSARSLLQNSSKLLIPVAHRHIASMNSILAPPAASVITPPPPRVPIDRHWPFRDRRSLSTTAETTRAASERAVQRPPNPP